MADTNKTYDIVLFGVTGFTGKLAAEYLFQRHDDYKIRWAASARNANKATGILEDILASIKKKDSIEVPPVLEADLVCKTPEQEEIL